MMKGVLQFLGTGASVGVPMLGCGCGTCRSDNPKNHRWRPSVLLKIGPHKILIDPGPDFRSQALQFGLTYLDAILLTHAHQDHVGGLDDLRPLAYPRKEPFPIYLSEATLHDLRIRFRYLIEVYEPTRRYLDFFLFSDLKGKLSVCDYEFSYMTYFQGDMPVNGYRMGSLAYVPDIRQYDPSLFNELAGVEDLIVGSLRYTHSLIHFTVDEALEFGNRAGASKIWLTHLSHELEYEQTRAYLPKNAFVAYDGLEIEFSL